MQGQIRVHRCSVLETDRVLPLADRAQFLDAIDIHDGRAMHPGELPRRQFRREIFHCLPLQIRFGADVNLDVIPACLHPVNLPSFQKTNPPRITDGDAREKSRFGFQIGLIVRVVQSSDSLRRVARSMDRLGINGEKHAATGPENKTNQALINAP